MGIIGPVADVEMGCFVEVVAVGRVSVFVNVGWLGKGRAYVALL